MMHYWNFIVLLLVHCSRAGPPSWPKLFQDCLVHVVGESSFESYNGYESDTAVIFESSVGIGFPDSFITGLGNTHFYQTKFSKCSVKILSLEDIVLKTSKYKIRSLAKYNVNPDYVVYVSNTTTDNWSNSAWNFCSTFFSLSSTAIFLIVSSSSDTANLVALHRQNPATMLEPVSLEFGVKERPRIVQQWNFLHQSLERRSVLILTEEWEVLSFQELLRNGGCGVNQHYEISERYCATFEISQHLNFTPFLSSTDPRIYGHVLLNVIYNGKDEEFNQALTTKAYPKYEWLLAAELQESFRFAVIIDSESLGSSAIWKPFDMETWLVFLLCFISIAIVLTLTGISCQASPSSFCYNIFSLLKIILEQTESFFNTLNSIQPIRKPKLMLMILWVWTALVLGNAYKGTLVSFLTNQILPVIPDTFEDLTQSSYNLFTTSSASELNGNETTVSSVLTDAILRDLMTGKKPGTDLPNYYLQLNSSVKFIHSPLPSLISAVSSGRAINSSVGLINIPKNFAIINSESDLTKLVQVIRRALPNKMIFLGGSMDTKFTTRLPWIAMRNFFKSIMSSLLARLYESGIYDKWSACIQTSHVNTYYQELMELSVQKSAQDPTAAEPLKFQDNWRRAKDSDDGSPSTPLTLLSLKNIFMLSLSGLLVSSWVFTGELVYRSFKN